METRFEDPTANQVWATLRRLNDCWTKGDGRGLVEYFHEEMVAITPSDRERRVGRDACVAGWVGFAAMARVLHWQEIDPRIQLYGDTAVVTYHFEGEFEMAGQRITLGGRDMFVFVRERGRWWAVADQFSPYPA